MRGKKKIRAALPYLSERELWFVKIDLHRAADAAAIGGATEAQWLEYVGIENEVGRELDKRFPETKCPFPRAGVDGWTDAELKEMGKMYNRIWKGKR